MGLFDGLVEGMLQGATLGLSDKIGITGKGGVVHDGDDDPEKQAVLIDGDGVYFIASQIQVEWKDVAAIEQVKDSLMFFFKGGLRVCTGWIVDATDDDANFGELAGYSRVTADLLDFECDMKELEKTADDLIWAGNLADGIRDSDEHLWLDEGNLFSLYGFMLANLDSHMDADGSRARRKKAARLADCLRDRLKVQFSRIAADDEDVRSSVSLALSHLSESSGCGMRWQKGRYEELSAAARYENDSDYETPRTLIIDPLLAFDGENPAFGSEAWSRMRKTIICTDEPMALPAFSEAERTPFAMVMDAADIEEYNAEAGPEHELVFQPGHPRNGYTYVQHPFRHNVYFEVNSYHDSLMERKQNELLRILESLGAYSAHVQVRHERQESGGLGRESRLAASGSYGVVGGSASMNESDEWQSTSSLSQGSVKDWTFNPPEKPCLPDDLVFYPTEETWQQLARSVLRGGLKRAVVDLEYKSEYGINEKHLSEMAASAKSVIPSFDLNLSSSFTENLHRLTATQWHYEVVFENESGERAGNGRAARKIASSQPCQAASKAEMLLAKRARRYAQSEGGINAEQRADLEAFAQKYGIADLRLEELIEEAFE